MGKEELYFVHGYYSSNNEFIENNNRQEIIRDTVILVRDNIEDVLDVEMIEVPISGQDYLPFEGEFVLYNKERIEPANNHPITLMYNILAQSLRESIVSSYTLPRNEDGNITDVKSFHVNVGHGNCSIVIFKAKECYKAWMIDCSIKEYKDLKYDKNLDVCLENLKSNYGIEKISRLLITHQHYDHINGIHHLLNKKWIDSNTEVWINAHYPWTQKSYLNIMSRLKAVNVKFINPVISNSTNNIKIIYPNISFSSANPAPKRRINNASVIYQIVFNDISMVFPGDIETEGWDQVNCLPWLNNATYYCVSHHGSINGHIRNICNCRKLISTVKDCTNRTCYQILMGRNGAYSGIFNTKVLTDFSGTLETTDGNFFFIELDWMRGKIVKV